MLDEVYQDVKQEVQKKLQEEQKVTLGCDGSSDGCQEPITHIVALTSNYPPFLVREVVHRDEEHSASNILGIIDEDVSNLKAVFYFNILC